MTTAGSTMWLYRHAVDSVGGVNAWRILSLSTEESGLICLSVYSTDYSNMAALLFLPSGKMRLIKLNFNNVNGAFIRGTYTQDLVNTALPRGIVKSFSKTFFIETKTNAGFNYDRIRELESSSDSCIYPTITSGILDFTIEGINLKFDDTTAVLSF